MLHHVYWSEKNSEAGNLVMLHHVYWSEKNSEAGKLVTLYLERKQTK